MPRFIARRLALGAALLFASVFPGSFRLEAATYYVSQTNGNDSYSTAQAMNPATPWQTIQNAANQLAPGDTVLIRAGTYRESVSVPISGTSNAPVTFQGYSNEVAIVSGANQVTGWVLESSNIYYAPQTLTLGNDNQLFQNGQMMPEARWPNAGTNFPWQNSSIRPSPDWAYVTTSGYSSGKNGWLTCAQFPSRPDGYWNGATLNIMSGYGWIMAAPTVTSYTSSTQTLVTTDANGSNPSYAITAGNEFYLTGVKGELDSPGEWWYDSVNARLYFYSATVPTNVEVKIRQAAFNVNRRTFIQIKNLSLFATTIETDSGSTGHVYDGLSIKYLMHSQAPFNTEPTTLYQLALQTGTVLKNSEIAYSSGNMVYLAGNNIRVVNNNLHDAGYIPDYYPLISCSHSAQQNLISHNSIHDSGRGLLSYLSRQTVVEFNDFSNGMRMSTDGAPVYDVNDSSSVIFDHNLVHDCPGPVGHLGFGVLGIYLDSLDSNWTLHHNLVYNIPSYGLCFNTLFTFESAYNNTFANCGAGLYCYGTQTQDAGTTLYNNIFSGSLTGLSWYTADMRFNLYTNPGFVPGSFQLPSNSPAIDQGVPVPGVTDGYMGAAPDLGALESGGTNWVTNAGCSATPLNPEPFYEFPNLPFVNQIIDGGFESGTLTNWSVVPGGNVQINSGDAWTSYTSRSGFYSLNFGAGITEIGQNLTNLQPNSRYVFYAGVYTANSTAAISLGATNYYGPVGRETVISASNAWELFNEDFVTGPTNTSAFVYLKVNTSGTTPVYADDLGVMLKPEPEYAQADPLVYYKLDETSGLTAFDSSGHGQNATLSNGPATSWTNGIINGAIYFNGSDVLLTPPLTTPTNGLTVACWAKSVSSTWNAYGCLVSQRPSFVLHPIMGSKEIRFLVSTNATTAVNADWVPPSTFNITQWHHYAGVLDASRSLATFYVDGLPVASTYAPSIYPVTGQVYIGKDDYTLDNFRNFIGSIDDVRIYNYPLSQSQVQTLATSNSSLVLHLAFDDGAPSAIAWDSTGRGGNGSLVNMNVNTAWTNGILNGALAFDGVNDRVVTPAIATPPSFTVSCWAKSATATWNASGCLISHRPAYALSPVIGTRNLQFLLYTNSTGYVTVNWSAPAGFDITQWHQYTGEFSASNQLASLYADGYLAASASASAVNPDNGAIYIGQDSAGGANANFSGAIDDVLLYSRVLAPNEILDGALVNSSSPFSSVVPGTPANFAATVLSASAITLSWTPAGQVQTGYILNYRLTGSTAWTALAQLPANANNIALTNLFPATSYDFQLEATNAVSSSGVLTTSATTLTTVPLTSAVNASGHFTLSFLRGGANLTYVLETTTNLRGTWNPIATNPGAPNSLATFTNTSVNTTPLFVRLHIWE